MEGARHFQNTLPTVVYGLTFHIITWQLWGQESPYSQLGDALGSSKGWTPLKHWFLYEYFIEELWYFLYYGRILYPLIQRLTFVVFVFHHQSIRIKNSCWHFILQLFVDFCKIFHNMFFIIYHFIDHKYKKKELWTITIMCTNFTEFYYW